MNADRSNRSMYKNILLASLLKNKYRNSEISLYQLHIIDCTSSFGLAKLIFKEILNFNYSLQIFTTKLLI